MINTLFNFLKQFYIEGDHILTFFVQTCSLFINRLLPQGLQESACKQRRNS